MRQQAGLSIGYWSYAILAAAHIRNRCPKAGLNVTPFEGWMGWKPDLKRLRTFGCIGYAQVPKDTRRKGDSKGIKCILLGYDPNSYILCDASKPKRIVRSRDVRFDEQSFGGIKSSGSSNGACVD